MKTRSLPLVLILLLVFLVLWNNKLGAESDLLKEIQDWQSYTNTTYLYNITSHEDKIYLSTCGGLSIYSTLTDDYKVLLKKDGLINNDIRCTHYVDTTNVLWIACYNGGISRYCNGKIIRPYFENDGLLCLQVNQIIDDGHYIFVATNKGLTVFEIISSTEDPILHQNYTIRNGLCNNIVKCIALDEQNRLWVGTNSGLSYVNIDSIDIASAWRSFSSSTSNLTNDKITALFYADNTIYIGTEQGISYVIDNAVRNLSFPYADYSISSLIVDSTGCIWASLGIWSENDLSYQNTYGIIKQETFIWGHWTEDDSDIINSISKLIIDNQGRIIASSWGEGFFIYNAEQDVWEKYKQNCIGFNFVSTLMVDSKSNLWCGSGIKGYSTSVSSKGASKFDGTIWTSYNRKNSPISSDNIMYIMEDNHKRIWFSGGWGSGPVGSGVSILENDSIWTYINSSTIPSFSSNNMPFLDQDKEGNIWIGAYGEGVHILKTDSTYYEFAVPFNASAVNVPDMWTMELIDNDAWFGCRYSGIRYWSGGTGFPVTNGEHWHKCPGFYSTSCFDIDSEKTDWGYNIWAATESGLIHYDGYNWHKYGNIIKLQYWNGYYWQDEQYYWVDEQGNYEPHLASGIISTINTVFVDPFGRKWLGTAGGGISVLDKYNQSFTNITTDNSPLNSNNVLSFAYDKHSGRLYIGTTGGINSVLIGRTSDMMTEVSHLYNIKVYPNPYFLNPSYKKEFLKIENHSGEGEVIDFPPDAITYIYNFNGDLVRKLKVNEFSKFEWDGKNSANKEVASGIYFYVISNDGKEFASGKIAVLR